MRKKRDTLDILEMETISMQAEINVLDKKIMIAEKELTELHEKIKKALRDTDND